MKIRYDIKRDDGAIKYLKAFWYEPRPSHGIWSDSLPSNETPFCTSKEDAEALISSFSNGTYFVIERELSNDETSDEWNTVQTFGPYMR